MNSGLPHKCHIQRREEHAHLYVTLMWQGRCPVAHGLATGLPGTQTSYPGLPSVYGSRVFEPYTLPGCKPHSHDIGALKGLSHLVGHD
jgi:hypothetical protein